MNTEGASAVPAEAPALVSLIIPSRNRPRLLLETVDSLLAGVEVPAEIIVIDQSDAPNDELAARVDDRTEFRYVWTSEIGVSRARNRGAQIARHPILAFLDDDVRTDPDWFAEMVREAVAAGPSAVISGRVLPERGRGEDGFVPSTIEDLEPATYRGRMPAGVLYSNNMIMHRATLEALGGFDERLGGGARFPTAEDNDLAHRSLEAGLEIRYHPLAVIEHRAWRTKREYLPLRWSYGRGQGAFYAKHLDLRDRFVLWQLRHDIAQRGIRFFRYFLNSPRRAIGQLVYLAGMLTGLIQWLLMYPRRR